MCVRTLAALSFALAMFAVADLASAQAAGPLERALAEAKAELKAERERIANEEASLAKELASLIAERNRQSDLTVDLRLRSADRAKNVDVEKLRDERERLRGEVVALERDVDEAARLIDGYRTRTTELLETLPPASGRPAVGETPGDLFALWSAILADGGTAEVFERQVTTPAGRPIAAEVLRIGHVAWAYRIPAGSTTGGADRGAVALLMRSPEGAKGYRWNVDLTDEQRRRIVRTIDAVKSGEDTIAPFPFDVTQQLTVEPTGARRTLFDTVREGGPVMIPIAVVALIAMLLIAFRFAFFMRNSGRATRMAERVVSLCMRGDLDEADRVVARARGPIPRALEACLGQRNGTAKAREDAIQESLMHEMPRVERFLSTIGILAAIAPLLGLLGTVTGMIITFEMIASFGTGDPRMMAGGISQALITTAAGLIVAIPVLLAHGFLSSMADRLMADTERHAATLLNVLRDRSGA